MSDNNMIDEIATDFVKMCQKRDLAATTKPIMKT